jgi:hypothetical protein
MTEHDVFCKFMIGFRLLDDADKAYLLDQIEEARWKTGPTYNRGVHILMDVVQYVVEASYVSPNIRNIK